MEQHSVFFGTEKVLKLSQQRPKDELQIFRVSKPKMSSKAAVEELGSYARVTFRLKPATVKCALAKTLQEEML